MPKTVTNNTPNKIFHSQFTRFAWIDRARLTLLLVCRTLTLISSLASSPVHPLLGGFLHAESLPLVNSNINLVISLRSDWLIKRGHLYS